MIDLGRRETSPMRARLKLQYLLLPDLPRDTSSLSRHITASVLESGD